MDWFLSTGFVKASTAIFLRVILCKKNLFHGFNAQPYRVREIIINDVSFVAMFILSLEQGHLLSLFTVGDCEADVTTKDDLVTAHVVEHHVLKLGHELFVVDQIKVNSIICADVDSDVTSDEEDVTFVFQRLIELPVSLVLSLVYLSLIKVNLL